MKKVFIFVITALLLINLSGCTSGEEDNDKPLVYTSFYPIYDLVKQVAGDSLNIKAFMPMNVDPHMWEPTAKDMKELSKAEILFVNGANMEKWVDKVKENLPELKIVTLADKVNLISYKGASDLGDFQYMAKLDAKSDETYKFKFGHTHEDAMRVCFIKYDDKLSNEEIISTAKKYMMDKGKTVQQKSTIDVEEGEVYAMEMAHLRGEVFFKFKESGKWLLVSDRISENILSYDILKENDEEVFHEDILTNATSSKDKITYDPHSWLSIKNAKKYIIEIDKVLREKYPENAKRYKKSSFKSLDKLTTINAQYKQKFDELKTNKEFVVTHYAWEYLAQEYGLIQYPLQGLISTESPSLKKIKKAVSFCNERKINTIFYETNVESKTADTLAQEVSGKAVDLTSMEYLKDAKNMEIGSYNKIMEENLEKLYQSMKRGE